MRCDANAKFIDFLLKENWFFNIINETDSNDVNFWNLSIVTTLI